MGYAICRKPFAPTPGGYGEPFYTVTVARNFFREFFAHRCIPRPPVV